MWCCFEAQGINLDKYITTKTRTTAWTQEVEPRRSSWREHEVIKLANHLKSLLAANSRNR
jgi:hypothetical protein